MSTHTHLSEDDICERALLDQSSETLSDLGSCAECLGEVRSMARVLSEIRRVDAAHAAPTEWDELLIRSRIRDAVAKEPAYVPSFLGRFAPFRAAFAMGLVAALALSAWSPLSRNLERADEASEMARAGSASTRIPAWTPLPDEADDEGLAVLAEWTPNEAELTVARCRAACQNGLSTQEETLLLAVSAANGARAPFLEASPL